MAVMSSDAEMPSEKRSSVVTTLSSSRAGAHGPAAQSASTKPVSPNAIHGAIEAFRHTVGD